MRYESRYNSGLYIHSAKKTVNSVCCACLPAVRWLEPHAAMSRQPRHPLGSHTCVTCPRPRSAPSPSLRISVGGAILGQVVVEWREWWIFGVKDTQLLHTCNSVFTRRETSHECLPYIQSRRVSTILCSQNSNKPEPYHVLSHTHVRWTQRLNAAGPLAKPPVNSGFQEVFSAGYVCTHYRKIFLPSYFFSLGILLRHRNAEPSTVHPDGLHCVA